MVLLRYKTSHFPSFLIAPSILILIVYHFKFLLFFSYMSGCVDFLMSCLKKERERPVAFRAVGQMVLVLKDRMDLQPVIQMVKTNLPISKDVGGK